MDNPDPEPRSETEVLREIHDLEYLAADYRTAPVCRPRLEFLRRLLAAIRDGHPDRWADYTPTH